MKNCKATGSGRLSEQIRWFTLKQEVCLWGSDALSHCESDSRHEQYVALLNQPVLNKSISQWRAVAIHTHRHTHN